MKKRILSVLAICMLCTITVHTNMSIRENDDLIPNNQSVSENTNELLKLSSLDTGEEVIGLDEMTIQTDVSVDSCSLNEKFDVSDELTVIGEVLYVCGIEIEDNVYKLYPEFSDTEDAMKNIREACAAAILYIENQGMPELTEKNIFDWHSYTNTLTVEKNDLSEEMMKEIRLLDEFLNIYENTELNEEIISIVESANGNLLNSSVLEAANIISELQYMVPYNTGCNEALNLVTEEMLRDVEQKYNLDQNELQIMYNEGQEELANKLELENSIESNLEEITYSGNSSFNISKGVTYAEKYAVTPNSKYTNWINSNKDCTNFVSQIKTAGGVKHYYSYVTIKSEHELVKSKSWYYSSGSNYGGIWPSADKFAKFFGVKSKTTNFKTFSSNVKKGSFIAYDKENDGKWNHMAFVTGKSTTLKTTNGVSYYNFKIAQHSKQYNKWVSHDDNRWEEIKASYPSVRFAIVY